MNKPEFVQLVKQLGGYSTNDEATLAIDTIQKAISKTLVKGDEISLQSFGKFSTKLIKGKSGVVPGTTKTYTTQDKMAPKFTASSVLKEAVANGE